MKRKKWDGYVIKLKATHTIIYEARNKGEIISIGEYGKRILKLIAKKCYVRM